MKTPLVILLERFLPQPAVPAALALIYAAVLAATLVMAGYQGDPADRYLDIGPGG